MRKRIIPEPGRTTPDSAEDWLDLEQLAEVEITSEDPDHPIENALQASETCWRAADPGKQLIRLVFAPARRIRRIRLEFVETDVERTQQYVLSWRTEGSDSPREIVRQQWNFSPQGATAEIEDHRVDLPNASTIELEITPDISGGDARACLTGLRLK